MATVAIRDETTAGETLAELELQLDAETVTVAELIRARVHQEVRDHNARRAGEPFRGLVHPTERRLNRPGKAARAVDAEQQTTVALRAFERGAVLVIVDDRQVTDGGAVVTLRPGTTVAFLKLVPLVGG